MEEDMTTEIRPAHSPLGASGAERWLNCPGSVALLKELVLPQSDEPEYRSLGTSAHAAANKCLVADLDAWEIIGQKYGVHTVDLEMCEPVQTFLDECRSLIGPESKVYLEWGIDAPEFHKDFYGTLDFGCVTGNHMAIRDYKHGEGIMVDVEWNPQVMYYAYGLLRHHPEVTEISLGIVQPRGFHPSGPIRTWDTTADAIRIWAEGELLDAMNRTALDADFLPGPWCRLCPAKLVCPSLTSLFEAAMTADPKRICNITDEGIGRSYQMLAPVESYIRAFKEETLRRLIKGHKIDQVKIVAKKADRVWKPEAEAVMLEKFPTDAFTEPKLKSPAQMEKVGAAAKVLTKQYAYTPESGPTVALASDKRPAITVQTVQEKFGAAIAALEE
jgi:hypothetical protein